MGFCLIKNVFISFFTEDFLNFFWLLSMRTLKQFEMKRLQKIVDNAPEPNDDYREIEAHNPNLVNF